MERSLHVGQMRGSRLKCVGKTGTQSPLHPPPGAAFPLLGEKSPTHCLKQWRDCTQHWALSLLRLAPERVAPSAPTLKTCRACVPETLGLWQTGAWLWKGPCCADLRAPGPSEEAGLWKAPRLRVKRDSFPNFKALVWGAGPAGILSRGGGWWAPSLLCLAKAPKCYLFKSPFTQVLSW